MQCFKSIASEKLEPANPLDPIDETVERMSIYPNEYCTGEFYQSLIVLCGAGILFYAIVLPLLVLWRAAKNSHIIYRTGANKEKPALEDDPAGSINDEHSVLFKYGFLFSGLVISRQELKYVPKVRMMGSSQGSLPKDKIETLKPSTGEEDQLEGGQSESPRRKMN